MAIITEELYQGSIVVQLNEEDHIYRIRGEYIPSSTSITGMLPKNLTKWAAEMSAEKIKADMIELARSPQGIRGTGIRQIQRICNDAKDAHTKHAEERADVGSEVHDWIHRYVNPRIGFPEGSVDYVPPMPTDPDGLRGVNAFLKFVSKYSIEWLFSERIVYSKRWGYTGTADLGCRINGILTLIDFKTGKHVYKEAGVQVVSYIKALQDELRVSEWNRERVDRGIVHISALTGELEYYDEDKIFQHLTRANQYRDFEVFLNCLDNFWWDANNKFAWQDKLKFKQPSKSGESTA